MQMHSPRKLLGSVHGSWCAALAQGLGICSNKHPRETSTGGPQTLRETFRGMKQAGKACLDLLWDLPQDTLQILRR